jgi:rhomboid protease GluP
VLKPNHLFLYALITVCCVIEATLSLADLGVIGPASLRQLIYDYGAFWPGLLNGWKPNYTAQPYVMFFTYAFLHGGLIHLSVNMISLWSLAHAVLDRIGAGGLALLYFGTGLCGAAGFAVLAPGLHPMVGASGSLFGLLGALVAWDYLDRTTDRQGLLDAARVVVLLIGLNLLLWWAMGGQLAWQTHFGGFVGGWIGALLLARWPLKDG